MLEKLARLHYVDDIWYVFKIKKSNRHQEWTIDFEHDETILIIYPGKGAS